MSYQAVLFDFDFTLADASEAIVAGFDKTPSGRWAFPPPIPTRSSAPSAWCWRTPTPSSPARPIPTPWAGFRPFSPRWPSPCRSSRPGCSPAPPSCCAPCTRPASPPPSSAPSAPPPCGRCWARGTAPPAGLHYRRRGRRPSQAPSRGAPQRHRRAGTHSRRGPLLWRYRHRRRGRPARRRALLRRAQRHHPRRRL